MSINDLGVSRPQKQYPLYRGRMILVFVPYHTFFVTRERLCVYVKQSEFAGADLYFDAAPPEARSKLRIRKSQRSAPIELPSLLDQARLASDLETHLRLSLCLDLLTGLFLLTPAAR